MIKTIAKPAEKKVTACGECRSTCQSACKTSRGNNISVITEGGKISALIDFLKNFTAGFARALKTAVAPLGAPAEGKIYGTRFQIQRLQLHIRFG